MNTDVIIIIAEDDENHAVLIRKNLERAGVKDAIIHFTNGQEVLDYFHLLLNKAGQRFSAHILILDVKMPKVDGIEVLKFMKEHPVLKKVPVIMLTTTDNPEEMALCHKYGCNSFIVKPINYEKFVEVIKRLGLYLKIIKVPNLN